MNDSSVTAVVLASGDRRLFFQDPSGTIRQASYSSADDRWMVDAICVVVSGAKNYTPLAAAYRYTLEPVPEVALGFFLERINR